jgi:hypothetical protein
VVSHWTDNAFIEYINSKLSISAGLQVWSPADISNIEDERLEVLNEYADALAGG